MSTFDPPRVEEGQDAIGGIGRRALALLLDNLLFVVPLLFIVLASGDIETMDEISTADQFWPTVLLNAAALVYHTVGIAVWGTTIGKRIMRLRVVNRVDGGPVSWTYSSVRALIPVTLQLIPFLGPGLLIVCYLRALFHPLRQGIHDAAAGTIVVRR